MSDLITYVDAFPYKMEVRVMAFKIRQTTAASSEIQRVTKLTSPTL